MYHSQEKKVIIIILTIFAFFLITYSYAYYQNITTRWKVTEEHLPPSTSLLTPTDTSTESTSPITFNWSSTDPDTSNDSLSHIFHLDIIPTITSPYASSHSTSNQTNTTQEILLDGTYYWRVEVTDSDNINTSETYSFTFNSHPLNNIPSLTNGSVTPIYGQPTTNFNYTVNYTDINNDPPSIIQVIIDSTNSTMTKLDSSDTDYTTPTTYYYNTTLPIGAHNYSFYASDDFSHNITPTTEDPFVSNNHLPEITLYSPNPGQIFSTCNITFSFNVTDIDSNLQYTELWLWKDGGSKQIYSITNNTQISLFSGNYEWQIYAADSFAHNTSPIRTFGVLATGKQTSTTIQLDTNNIQQSESFTGNLVITNEGDMPSYECYWYVSLYDSSKTKELTYDSGSKALTTSIEVTFSIPANYDPDTYYLIAKTYDNDRSTGSLLGQDERLVAITSETINTSSLTIAWNSLIYDTPRYIIDLSTHQNKTEVTVPTSYNYSFLFISGSRSLQHMEMYHYTTEIEQIQTVLTGLGTYSFGDLNSGTLIIVPNPSPTDCSWVYNLIHTGDVS